MTHNTNEIVTIVGIICLAGLSMFTMGDIAKDIVLPAITGLIGYLKGYNDGQDKILNGSYPVKPEDKKDA